MEDADAVRTELAAIKSDLQTAYPIREFGVFGSYARDEQGPESELDVLVTFDRAVTPFELVRLENERLRRTDLDLDLVTRESLTADQSARRRGHRLRMSAGLNNCTQDFYVFTGDQ